MCNALLALSVLYNILHVALHVVCNSISDHYQKDLSSSCDVRSIRKRSYVCANRTQDCTVVVRLLISCASNRSTNLVSTSANVATGTDAASEATAIAVHVQDDMSQEHRAHLSNA